MNAKKNALVLSMLAVISTPSWAVNETGEINFIGSIHAGACAVGVSTPDGVTTGLSEAGNLVIQLAPINASELVNIGDTGESSEFSVDVIGCDHDTVSNITLALVGAFDGSTIPAKDSLGKLRDDVSFQIKGGLDGDTPTTQNWATDTLSVDAPAMVNNGYQFPMSVEYYSNRDTAPAAGIVRGSLTYLVSYE